MRASIRSITPLVVTAASLIGFLVLARPASSEPPGARVYVANELSNSISVIDPASNQLVGTIPLDRAETSPFTFSGHYGVNSLVASPDRSTIVATARESSTAISVDTATSIVNGVVQLENEPSLATFAPDGEKLWIAVQAENYIAVVDAKRMQIVERLPTINGPGMVWFSPSGGFAFVGSVKEPRVQLIETASRARLRELPMPGIASFVMMSPDNSELWVTHADADRITVLDGRLFEPKGTLETGQGPMQLAMVNGRAYV